MKLCYKYTKEADQNVEVTEGLVRHTHCKKGSICKENANTTCTSTYSHKVPPHPIRKGAETYLIPLAQTALFNLVSMRTSGVPISFIANLRISLRARGARFLKPLGQTQEQFL